MLPRPYLRIYSGEKGHKIIQQSWIITLDKSVETFILVSISGMPTIKYWHNLEITTDKAKEIIPNECRIDDTFFTSLAAIGGNLYTRHQNNFKSCTKRQ